MFKNIRELVKKGEEFMAIIYATLIINGKKTFKEVPKLLKERVGEILIDLDLEHLTLEE